MKLNKTALVEQLAIRIGLPLALAELAINSLVDIIYTTLKEGGTVSISGFGQFSVSHRKARLGVLPREPIKRITIPALDTPKFKAGEAFKKAVSIK